ncbi:ribose 5-phosphate isomerase A [Deinococcus maricopensis]|uniref:Ribose-5-phosphate isomerase A n=1 Tax=Deinococcus maricopensis (strain DSM 21211 / LMG 22137 / NRRL B-23946 / LB-34) TaxID=709986 RepID=E8UAB6_DEIML|nr:ribose 5-phosphate isomerase A [Deinococcus maricopensis]ADV68005.1 Ribose-5-phosphate isomerase A [Deinococcus maricopensis DSM 21211]
MDLEALKKDAALRAVTFIRSGMRVGLGTGSTAKYAIEELGRKVTSGELTGITAVATSEASDALARAVGITVEDLDPRPFDVAIDGADEIDPQLNLIKGLGGALLREKLVEIQAREFIVIADHTKIVTALGEKAPLPIEVAQFGVVSTTERLRALGATGELRMNGDRPFVTDNGNFIFHARFPAGHDLTAAERSLKGTLGVVDTGLFIGMATRAFVAAPEGVRELHR